MALSFSLSQRPKLGFSHTGFTTRTEPFAEVTQKFGMPSLLETAPVGPSGSSFIGEAYVVPESPKIDTAPKTDTASKSGWSEGLSNGMQGASIGLAIGQMIGSVYSAYSTGKTLKYVSKKQEEIAENNRQMAQMSAESAYRQGESQMAQLTYKAGQVKAQQRVAMGANGVKIGSGSTAEVLASTEVMKRLDMNSVKLNAISSAWGYKAQGLQASNAGSIARIMGDYRASEGVSQAAGSLLEKGSVVADRWSRYFGGS